MKGAINVIAAALLLMLAGCAQKPAPEAGFRSQGAASYVHAHGLKVDMQLPQAFVGASTVIDAKVAQDAAKSSHNLIANSGGALTQTGSLMVAGTTNLTASGFDITLANKANSLTGSVTFNGANISLTNNRATVLAASSATGTLAVSASGAITQNGALNASGNASFTATDITLQNAGNIFGGTVDFTGANVAIFDSTALALAASTATDTHYWPLNLSRNFCSRSMNSGVSRSPKSSGAFPASALKRWAHR